jgi:hypothetical protein
MINKKRHINLRKKCRYFCHIFRRKKHLKLAKYSPGSDCRASSSTHAAGPASKPTSSSPGGPRIRRYHRPLKASEPDIHIYTIPGFPDAVFSNQKLRIGVNFGGPWNGKGWPFGIYYGHLEYFMAIWNILRPFRIFYSNLEYITAI